MLRLSPLFSPSDLSQNVVKRALKIELLTQKNRLKGGFSMKGGPSDRIRTCGILLPKQARYQLRFTRLLSYFIRLVVFTQTRRDTNFAIPGYSLFRHDTTANGKNKVFSVCGQTCGQSRLCTAFSNRRKSRKCRCRKALRRFTLPYPGYRHGTPKPGAIPASLYPDMRVSADKHSAIIAKAAGECKHFLILKKN